MQLEQSSMWPEIQSVVNSGAKPVHFSWRATIHVNRTGVDIPAQKVLSIDTRSDFEANYTDYTILRVVLTGGVYANQVYPFQDDLEITLTQYPIGETSDGSDGGGKVAAKRYQATLRDNGNPLMQGQSQNLSTQTALDLTNVLEIEFQLMDKTVEQLSMVSVGGVWRNCTMEDFLRTTLTNYSQTAVVDAAIQIKGVDVATPSNTAKRDHIVVPHGTRLLDLPDYVQHKCGGIYSTGLGSYLRDQHWYLYPLLDYTRAAEGEDLVTILVVPPSKFSGAERTYRQDPGNLVLVASGELNFQSDSQAQQLNYGNGVRFADATKLLEGVVKTANNKTLAARGALVSEFVTLVRKSGLNNVQKSSNPITANPHVEASKLARRNGAVVSLLWEHSNAALLKPSSTIQILYMQNERVRTLRGVLLKTQTHIGTAGRGLTNSRYISNTGISCFVETPSA